MKKSYIKSEYITLSDFMKYEGLVMTGGEAKELIQSGRVKVNGEVEIRRGKKLRENDKVEFEKEIYCIVKEI